MSGANTNLVYTFKNGKWDYNSPNTIGLEIITFEQWNEAVNGKDPNICDTCKEPLFLEPSDCHKCGIEEKQPRLKVGDKIPEYVSGKIYFNSTVQKNISGIFTTNGEHKVILLTDNIYFVKVISGYALELIISDVDALIEEHEREMKEPSMFSLNERINQAQDEVIKKYEQETKQPIDSFSKSVTEAMMNPYFAAPFKDYMNPLKDKEEWIPKNGDEVEVANYDVWEAEKTFIGMFGVKYVVYDHSRSKYSAYNKARKFIPKVTKTHSEIAELLGIAKEQLKIVEG